MTAWSTAPTIFICAPACPHCGALRPIIIRTEQNGDDTVTRRCVCRRCSTRFKVVIEPPEQFSGNVPEFGKGQTAFDRIPV